MSLFNTFLDLPHTLLHCGTIEDCNFSIIAAVAAAEEETANYYYLHCLVMRQKPINQ